MKYVLPVAGLIALLVGATGLSARPEGEPLASKEGTVQHHFVKSWTLSSDKDLDIKLKLPSGWCIAEGATFYSADFYRPKEEYPTFFMITYARLPMSFEALCEKDIARLTKPADGDPMAVKKMPALMDGRMLIYQFDTAGEGSHCLTGYQNIRNEYMVKVMMTNTVAISPSLKTAFERIVGKMKIIVKHPTMTQEEALAEASRRVKAAGAEGMKGVEYGGGDGATYETAVLISNVRNIFGCVSAQYAWLDAHYPGYVFQLHASDENGGRSYSVIRFSFNGEQKTVYFDIGGCPHD